MATNLELVDLPSDISESYLPYQPTLRQRQKAYAFSRNSYVHNVKICGEGQDNILQISAKVYRSQRKSETPHQVNMTVCVSTKTITDAYCSCKAGISGECAHLLATIMSLQNWLLEGYQEIPAEQSCTSLPQTWDKPRGPKIQPESISQMVVCKPTTITRKRKPLVASFHDNRKTRITEDDLVDLQKIIDCPISYMAQNVKKTSENQPYGPEFIGCGLSYHAPLMNPVQLPTDSTFCGNLKFPGPLHFELPQIVQDNKDNWHHLNLTFEESLNIEKDTRNQSESREWHKQRKYRITASNFGKIMKRKATINEKFLKNMFGGNEFVSTPTTYGKINEKVARQMYIKKTRNHAHNAGLVIHPELPYLGATPDGKTCDNGVSGILEIKCPYSVRDMTLSHACDDQKYGPTFFLEKSGQMYKLKKTHEHWFQVQGQLMVTGASFCDFVTYTRKDFNTERIFLDKATMECLLNKLTNVYINHVKPFLEATRNVTV